LSKYVCVNVEQNRNVTSSFTTRAYYVMDRPIVCSQLTQKWGDLKTRKLKTRHCQKRRGWKCGSGKRGIRMYAFLLMCIKS